MSDNVSTEFNKIETDTTYQHEKSVQISASTGFRDEFDFFKLF